MSCHGKQTRSAHDGQASASAHRAPSGAFHRASSTRRSVGRKHAPGRPPPARARLTPHAVHAPVCMCVSMDVQSYVQSQLHAMQRGSNRGRHEPSCTLPPRREQRQRSRFGRQRRQQSPLQPRWHLRVRTTQGCGAPTKAAAKRTSPATQQRRGWGIVDAGDARAMCTQPTASAPGWRTASRYKPFRTAEAQCAVARPSEHPALCGCGRRKHVIVGFQHPHNGWRVGQALVRAWRGKRLHAHKPLLTHQRLDDLRRCAGRGALRRAHFFGLLRTLVRASPPRWLRGTRSVYGSSAAAGRFAGEARPQRNRCRTRALPLASLVYGPAPLMVSPAAAMSAHSALRHSARSIPAYLPARGGHTAPQQQ